MKSFMSHAAAHVKKQGEKFTAAHVLRSMLG